MTTALRIMRRRTRPGPTSTTSSPACVLSAPTPLGLLTDKRLTPLCTKVWTVCDLFAAPSLDEIARLVAATPRAVQDAISRLDSCGWLLRCSRAAWGRNLYVALHSTPPAARAAEAAAEAMLKRMSPRGPKPMTEADQAAVDAWNGLTARTRRDPHAW